MIRATVLLLLFGTAAIALECPAEQPIKRKITVYPTHQWCTLLACLPKLVCPPEGDCFYAAASDCNSCSPPISTVERCFSQKEFDEALKGVLTPGP